MEALKLVPEFLSAIVFLPMGAVMGYTIYLYSSLNSNEQFDVFCIKFLPFIFGICGALISTMILTVVKIRMQKYVFEHFYVILAGLLSIVIGSNMMLVHMNEPTTALYFMFFGHGLCYIPAITYMHIRSSAHSPRLHKLSIAYAFYLLGVAIGVTCNVPTFSIFSVVDSVADLNVNFSIILVIITSWITLGFAINEILTRGYKSSLDNEFQRLNEHREIFRLDDFEVLPSSETSSVKTSACASLYARYKHIIRIIFALLSKANSLIYFFYPFHFLNMAGTSNQFYIAPWIGFLGAVVSSAALVKQMQVASFMISCCLKITALLFITYFTNSEFVIWASFFLFGFGYSFSDLNILELTALKYSEIILYFGYCIEMFTIGTVLYSVTFDPENWFHFFYVSITMNSVYILPFVVIFLITAICAALVIPHTYKQSILDMKSRLRSS